MKKVAYFGAGCFWGVEKFFNETKGVIDTEVGFMGGNVKLFPNPSYKMVCYLPTGYAETVKVIYDDKKIKYDKLVELFFKCHDSTQKNRQGFDIGRQYRSVIFYKDESELKIVKNVMEKEQKILKKKIATSLEKEGKFVRAEDYHQKYWKTHKVSCHVRE
jgi:methionine-S-sulfoxide reductase